MTWISNKYLTPIYSECFRVINREEECATLLSAIKTSSLTHNPVLKLLNDREAAVRNVTLDDLDWSAFALCSNEKQPNEELARTLRIERQDPTTVAIVA